MILLLGFLMMTGVAVAQQLQVQGKVTDATGEGLIGASVLVKGTTSGVITDIDGNYVLLNVNPDAILIFSYVGYQTQELNVSGRNKIDVVLHDDQQVLEEVVVVGYGSLSKKEVSSSIVQVDKKNFNFNSSLTKISLRVFSSFISSHWIPICSNISIAVFAKRPFARAKVKYLILLTYNSTAPSFETYVILVAPSSFLNVVYSSNDIFSFLEINSVLTP